MTYQRITVPLLLSGLLVGCGGGGGGSGESTNTPPPPSGPSASVALDQSTLTLDEGNETSVSFSFEEGSDLTVSSSSDAVTATINDGVLTLSASEVDRPVTTTISLTSVIEDDEASDSLSIYVKNVSADALVTQVESLLDDRDRLVSLSDDVRLYEFFIDFAYLGGVITSAEKVGRMRTFDPLTAASYAPLDRQIAALGNVLNDYDRGNVPDTDLQAALTQTESLLQDHSAYGKDQLNGISDFAEVIVPGFVPADLAYDPNSGLYSRFLSNDEFGTYTDGEYQFDAAFSALSSLVRLSPNDSALCEGA